jgi:hypothetical protein
MKTPSALCAFALVVAVARNLIETAQRKSQAYAIENK